jgi:hypothetical protein
VPNALKPGGGRTNRPSQLLIIGLFSVMLSPSLDACTCRAQPACGLPTDYPLVFVGRVAHKQVDHGDRLASVAPAIVTFEVAEYLRGQEGPRVDIRTTEGCCACGYTFVEGVDYLVFASGGFSTGECTPTQPLRTASALIEQLRLAAATGSPAQIFGFVGVAPLPPSGDQTQPLDSIPIRAVGTTGTFETKTSPAGAYAFHNLPVDTYRVEPVLPAGLTTAEAALGRTRRSLELGPNSKGCQTNIRVFTDGRISGLVLNKSGEPRRAFVGVIPADRQPQKILGTVVSDTTSGDGRFRLPLLSAGRYILVYSPESAGRINHQQRFYYPGASVPAEAKVIELAPGEHLDSIRLVVPD